MLPSAGTLLALSAFAACGAFACSSSHDRAPYSGMGTNNFHAPDQMGGEGAGSGGDAAGAPDTGTLGNGTLTGTVSVYVDTAFVTTKPFTGDGTLVVRGTHDVTAPFSGSSFSVDQVDPMRALWVGLRATSQAIDLMPTVTPADGAATTVALAFGKTSALTDILGMAVVTPQTLQSDRAQIVVGFVTATASPVPLAGIQITQHPGAAVIYDSGSAYSDSFGVTQGRGIAIIANAQASAQFPGGLVTVTYKSTTTSTLGTFTVYAAQGALTIASVPVK